METTHYLDRELDSFNSQQVQDQLLATLEEGNSVLLDMAACKYISSTGLRVLLYSKKTAAAKGLQFRLRAVSDEVMDIMTVTGFDKFFEIVK